MDDFNWLGFLGLHVVMYGTAFGLVIFTRQAVVATRAGKEPWSASKQLLVSAGVLLVCGGTSDITLHAMLPSVAFVGGLEDRWIFTWLALMACFVNAYFFAALRIQIICSRRVVQFSPRLREKARARAAAELSDANAKTKRLKRLSRRRKRRARDAHDAKNAGAYIASITIGTVVVMAGLTALILYSVAYDVDFLDSLDSTLYEAK